MECQVSPLEVDGLSERRCSLNVKNARPVDLLILDHPRNTSLTTSPLITINYHPLRNSPTLYFVPTR
jgi:hypothetical protein